MADSIEGLRTRIRLASQSYELAIWSNDLALADRYWQLAERLRHELRVLTGDAAPR